MLHMAASSSKHCFIYKFSTSVAVTIPTKTAISFSCDE